MSKKALSRALCMFLAVMLAATLGACGQSNPTEQPAATQTATASASSAEPAEKEKPAETVTLQVFSMPSNKSGLMEGWWANILKKEVGVQLELLPSGDQGEQKLQALMAGGELPDIVVFKSKKQVEDAVKANMLVNLDEHLDKLPNVTKNVASALQYYRDSASNGTGKAYAIPNGVGPGEVGDEINWGPFLRWDLYEKLGMPEVSTLEDYLPLLKKMQELEPKTADGQKVYGLTLWKDWDSWFMHQATQPSVIAGADTGDQLGASLPYLQVNLNTGETKSILAPDSEYIRALKFYFKANQMGLVDPDSLTQRFDTALQKAGQGRVLFAWWPWFVGDYNKPDNTNSTPPKGFRPVLTKDYKAFWWGDNKVGNVWAFAIGASTKNLDACLKYVDFMYSTDGLMQLLNGPKGVTWDINDKGPYITDAGWDYIENQKELPEGGKVGDGTSIVNSYGLSAAFTNPATNSPLGFSYWSSSQGRNPTKLIEDWQKVTGFKTTSQMLKEKNMRTITPLSMKLIATMSDDMNTQVGKIGDIIKTQSWVMVFAKNETEFNKLYEDMVKKAEGLGIQQVLDWDNQEWKKAQEEAKKYDN